MNYSLNSNEIMSFIQSFSQSCIRLKNTELNYIYDQIFLKLNNLIDQLFDFYFYNNESLQKNFLKEKCKISRIHYEEFLNDLLELYEKEIVDKIEISIFNMENKNEKLTASF